jgi:hypothetical protein
MPEKINWFELELLYPENWTVEVDEDSDTLNLISPSGAFMSMTRPEDINSAFEQARQAMEQEYEEMETENVCRIVGDGLLDGIIQRFVYLDFIVTSQLMKLESEIQDFQPLLIQIQGEDRDLDQQQQVFDAILTSFMLKQEN